MIERFIKDEIRELRVGASILDNLEMFKGTRAQDSIKESNKIYEAERKIENRVSFYAYEIGFILNRSINEKLREVTALSALREEEIKNQLNHQFYLQTGGHHTIKQYAAALLCGVLFYFVRG